VLLRETRLPHIINMAMPDSPRKTPALVKFASRAIDLGAHNSPNLMWICSFRLLRPLP
jgi:hypothetical protein